MEIKVHVRQTSHAVGEMRKLLCHGKLVSLSVDQIHSHYWSVLACKPFKVSLEGFGLAPLENGDEWAYSLWAVGDHQLGGVFGVGDLGPEHRDRASDLREGGNSASSGHHDLLCLGIVGHVSILIHPAREVTCS